MNFIQPVLNRASFALILLTGFLSPIFILPAATDPFVLPKQALVLGVVLLLLVFSGVRLLTSQELRLVRTPFDLPLVGLSLVLIVSTFLSISKWDSAVTTVSLLSLILFYYMVINQVRTQEQSVLFAISLFSGTALAGVVLMLGFAKIYPLTFAQNLAAASFGNLLSSSLFLLISIPSALGFLAVYRNRSKILAAVFSLVTILIAASLMLSVYELFNPPAPTPFGVGPAGGRPTFLPYEFGLQAATGAIGQNFQGLLFGSGPGTFLIDFTRFHAVSFNNLLFWNSVFFSSSSLFLELLATIGLLGVTFFILILFSVLRTTSASSVVAIFSSNRSHLGLFVSLALFALLAFLLPLGFIVLFLFFSLLSLYTISLSKIAPKEVFDTKIHVVNLREGIGVPTNILSFLFIILAVLIAGAGTYFGARFLVADAKFQSSLVAASQNRGLDTYNLQREAISIYPYRDGFYRVFSQTNLALANSISQDLRTRNASPSAQDQQTIVTLIQQAINNTNAAVSLSPLNFLNYDARAAIYRSLIGFGRDADRFAILSLSQAIRLNPTSPTLYIGLGGIYYQLGQWENAQRQFEVAVRLKPDFANAYYNLGHALENKGDLQGALLQYQTVEALLSRVNKDSDDYKKTILEIDALKERISREGGTVSAVPPPVSPLGGPTPQERLQVSTPSATLPSQKPPVEILGPKEATESGR